MHTSGVRNRFTEFDPPQKKKLNCYRYSFRQGCLEIVSNSSKILSVEKGLNKSDKTLFGCNTIAKKIRKIHFENYNL